MERPNIKPVDVSIRTNFEALANLYTEAFHRHPFALELGLVEERSLRVLMRSLMELYSFGFEDTLVYGVVVDGSVVCASVSMSSESHAKIGAMLRFASSSIRLMGLHAFWKLVNAFYFTVPKYEEPHLYVALLATLPSHQRRGYGRTMLRFLLEKARKLGFKGLALSTVKGLPAYRLYLKEGFKVDREAPMGKLTVCHMSKPVR